MSSDSAPPLPSGSPAEAPPRPLARSERLWIAFCFVFPAAHHFASILPRFSSAALGDSGDIPVHLWSLWHTARALAGVGESVYQTSQLLAPLGTTLIYNTTCVFPSLLAAPVVWIAGLFAGYNMLLLAETLFAGWGTYLLARHLSGSATAAGFSAFLVQMSPALFFRLISHFSLLALGFLPLVLYVYLRAGGGVAGRRWWGSAGGAGAIMTALFYTDYNLFVYAIFLLTLLAVLRVAYALEGRERKVTADFLRFACVSAAAFAVLVLPFFWFAPFQDTRAWHDASPNPLWGRYLGSDVAFYVIPNPRYWLLADWLPAAVHENAPIYDEQAAYLGFLPMLLALPGFIALGRRHRAAFFVLFLTLAISLLVSLGYKIIRFSYWVDIPAYADRLLLFRYMSEIPLFSQLRVPARWSLLLSLVIMIGAGCGWAWIEGLVANRRWKSWLPWAAALLVFVEFGHKPTPISEFSYPPAYEAIGKAASPREMILELPLGFLWGTGKVATVPVRAYRMVHATRHEYAIVSCYLSRISTYRIQYILNQPLIRDLWIAQGGDVEYLTASDPTPSAAALEWARLNHLRFVVLEKYAAQEPIRRRIEEESWLSVVFEDSRYVVYRVDAEPAHPPRDQSTP